MSDTLYILRKRCYDCKRILHELEGRFEMRTAIITVVLTTLVFCMCFGCCGLTWWSLPARWKGLHIVGMWHDDAVEKQKRW